MLTGEISAQLSGLVGPSAADVIQKTVANTQSPFTGIVASAIRLVTLLFGSSGVFNELRIALNRDVNPTETSGLWACVRQEFLSFGMVLGIGFLLLVSLILSAALGAFGGWFSAYSRRN